MLEYLCTVCVPSHVYDAFVCVQHVLDCVFEKSFSNPIDRDAALLQLNSSCLVWSRGVQFSLVARGMGSSSCCFHSC